MRFTKMHGAANDYLFIDARQLDADWPDLAVAMSDRHRGVGSDGIILVLPSEQAQLRMRIFNADGSEGEMCGNGIRCFAKYAIERGLAEANGRGLLVETLAGVRTVTPRMMDGHIVAAKVAMGRPELRPEAVPVTLDSSPTLAEGTAVLDHPLEVGGKTLALSFVSMGNPHAVAFIDEAVGDFPLHQVGPMVEHHPIFPRRTNFEIVNLGRGNALQARVWERGSGETMACGTGACAIAVVARLHGKTHERFAVTLPGGTLTIEWDGEGEVYLEGPAEEVFSGEWQ